MLVLLGLLNDSDIVWLLVNIVILHSCNLSCSSPAVGLVLLGVGALPMAGVADLHTGGIDPLNRLTGK